MLTQIVQRQPFLLTLLDCITQNLILAHKLTDQIPSCHPNDIAKANIGTVSDPSLQLNQVWLHNWAQRQSGDERWAAVLALCMTWWLRTLSARGCTNRTSDIVPRCSLCRTNKWAPRYWEDLAEVTGDCILAGLEWWRAGLCAMLSCVWVILTWPQRKTGSATESAGLWCRKCMLGHHRHPGRSFDWLEGRIECDLMTVKLALWASPSASCREVAPQSAG